MFLNIVLRDKAFWRQIYITKSLILTAFGSLWCDFRENAATYGRHFWPARSEPPSAFLDQRNFPIDEKSERY